MFDSGDGNPIGDTADVSAANTVLRMAMAIDPATLDGHTLRQTALDLETIRRSLDALSLRVLAEIDKRGATDATDGMQTGPWLAHQAGLPTGPTRGRVQIAKKLRTELPEVDTAMADGRIGFDHARVLANAANPRIIDEFKKIIGDLIDLVPHMTFARWRNEVNAIANLLDEDGGHKPGDDIKDNTLSISPFLDNTILFDAQLTGEFALTVRDALMARADKLFKQFSRDAELTSDLPVPPRRTLLALALVELIHEGLARDPKSTVPARPSVSLVINADDPDTVTDLDGVVIGDTGRFSCLCDPVFHPVVMNAHGIVTDVGRGQRLATTAQRRAMAHRDGGCVWPGCENPASWTDAHHIQHWNKGGKTDMSNLASLCRYHHGVTHRDGWTMGATEDQHFWWKSPSGSIFRSQRHGRLSKPRDSSGHEPSGSESSTHDPSGHAPPDGGRSGPEPPGPMS